jgi:hypothetical protein
MRCSERGQVVEVVASWRRRSASRAAAPPEYRRLSSVDPSDDAVIEAHADAVCQLLFGDS